MSEDEQRDLLAIIRLLDHVKDWDAVRSDPNGLWNVHPSSSLAGDDKKADPYLVSGRAWNHIGVAIDHLQCFRDGFVSSRDAKKISTTLHTHAQFSLLRGVLENGASATWLLEPITRCERVARRLQLELAEVTNRERNHKRAEEAAAGHMTIPPLTPSATERRDRIRKIAVVAGLDEEAAKSLKPVTYADIVYVAGEKAGIGGAANQLVWSLCSGLAHGDLWGSIHYLKKKIVKRVGNTVIAQTTSDVGNLLLATQASILMLKEGLTLFVQRAQYL